MKQLIEKYREKRKELHVAFMDPFKTSDKVCRKEMWRVLPEYGIDDYLIRIMSNLYDGSRARVRFGSTVR